MTNIVLRDLFVRQYQSLSPKTFFLSRQNGIPSLFSGSGFFFTKDFQLLLGGEDTLYVTIELNHHRKCENNEIIVWRNCVFYTKSELDFSSAFDFPISKELPRENFVKRAM